MEWNRPERNRPGLRLPSQTLATAGKRTARPVSGAGRALNFVTRCVGRYRFQGRESTIALIPPMPIDALPARPSGAGTSSSKTKLVCVLAISGFR